MRVGAGKRCIDRGRWVGDSVCSIMHAPRVSQSFLTSSLLDQAVWRASQHQLTVRQSNACKKDRGTVKLGSTFRPP